MPLNSDGDIAKEDRLMMPHYKTAKTDHLQPIQQNTLGRSLKLCLKSDIITM